MTRQFHQDPTEFFSVVGGPFLREHHRGEYQIHRTDDPRPGKLEIGIASIFTGFCAVALGVLLFANSGAAGLVKVAYNAVR
jgi:hypothetical protein